jgi:acyl-CoA synthetase (NDP forming)
MTAIAMNDEMLTREDDASARSEALLEALLQPSVVAVVGVSAASDKIGNSILRNVVKNGFPGRVYAVAREPMTYPGATVVTALADIPEPVDIALLAVPAAGLLPVLRGIPRGRVRLAVAIASGFSEIGDEGRQLEDALRTWCRTSGMPLVGPNCQGIVVPAALLQMTFSPMYNDMIAGSVAILSQSGAMGGYMANRLMQRGVGLRCFVSIGNETALSSTDYIEALNRDPGTRVILCYLEQIVDGRRFAAVVRGLDPAKRLVIVKTGRTPSGAAAVSTHTGALAGDDRVVNGVFRQLGIIRARDSATAVDAAAAISTGRELSGNRIGVLSIAGGLAVELTDLLGMRGFDVPEVDPGTRAKLKEIVPAFGATRNPVDLTGAVLTDQSLFERSLEIFAAALNLDGFAIISTYVRDPRYAEAIVRLFRASRKPVVVCWTGNVAQTPESLAILAAAGVPVFDNTARTCNALCALRGDAVIG